MHRRENPARILIITGIALKSDDLEREESAFPGTPVYRYHRNLLSETGLRVSEGLSLYVEDLDLSLDNEHLTAIGKGDKRRTVLLDDPRLVYQFRAYLKQMGYKHEGRWSERKRTGNDNAPLESSNQVRYIFNSSSNRNTSSPRYPMTSRIDYTDIDYTVTLDAHIALLQSCRAYEYYKWQHYEEALAIYEQALQLNPLDASSYNGKGDVLRKLRRPKEALVAYEQAIRLDPNDAASYQGKGNALKDLHYDQEALVAYEQAIRLDPSDADSYCSKGDILYLHNRLWEALDTYEQVIRLSPDDTMVHRRKGHVLLHLQQYEQALAAYEQAIRLDANDSVSYSSKGRVYLHLQQYEQALAAYEQAIRLDPSNVVSYSNKGHVHLYLQQYEQAFVAYAQAIRLDPSNTGIYVGKIMAACEQSIHLHHTSTILRNAAKILAFPTGVDSG